MAATSGGYPDYSQMTAASQGGIPAAAPGAQPRLETPAAADYSAYGEKACPFYCTSRSFVKISFPSVALSCLAMGMVMAMRPKTNMGDDCTNGTRANFLRDRFWMVKESMGKMQQ